MDIIVVLTSSMDVIVTLGSISIIVLVNICMVVLTMDSNIVIITTTIVEISGVGGDRLVRISVQMLSVVVCGGMSNGRLTCVESCCGMGTGLTSESNRLAAKGDGLVAEGNRLSTSVLVVVGVHFDFKSKYILFKFIIILIKLLIGVIFYQIVSSIQKPFDTSEYFTSFSELLMLLLSISSIILVEEVRCGRYFAPRYPCLRPHRSCSETLHLLLLKDGFVPSFVSGNTLRRFQEHRQRLKQVSSTPSKALQGHLIFDYHSFPTVSSDLLVSGLELRNYENEPSWKGSVIKYLCQKSSASFYLISPNYTIGPGFFGPKQMNDFQEKFFKNNSKNKGKILIPSADVPDNLNLHVVGRRMNGLIELSKELFLFIFPINFEYYAIYQTAALRKVSSNKPQEQLQGVGLDVSILFLPIQALLNNSLELKVVAEILLFCCFLIIFRFSQAIPSNFAFLFLYTNHLFRLVGVLEND